MDKVAMPVLSEGLSIHPDDIEKLRYYINRLLPGKKMFVQNGKILYEYVDKGITKKGVSWANVHVDYRENGTYTVRDRALPWLIGKGIDIGCGLEKVKEDNCIGVDSGHDYDDRCAADDFRDSTDLTGYEDGQFDWVYSSNNLEHLEEWEKALDEWVRVLRPGGVIFLYLPWAQLCRPMSKHECAYHLHDFTPTIIRDALENRNVSVVECDDDIDVWGTFVIIGRKR